MAQQRVAFFLFFWLAVALIYHREADSQPSWEKLFIARMEHISRLKTNLHIKYLKICIRKAVHVGKVGEGQWEMDLLSLVSPVPLVISTDRELTWVSPPSYSSWEWSGNLHSQEWGKELKKKNHLTCIIGTNFVTFREKLNQNLENKEYALFNCLEFWSLSSNKYRFPFLQPHD